MEQQLSLKTRKRLIQFQKEELNGSLLYEMIAKRQKSAENQAVLMEFAKAERSHYEIWKLITQEEVKPNWLKIHFFRLVSLLLGYTFTLKYLERNESFGIQDLESIKNELPEALSIIADEEKHENYLTSLIDEERLHYVGSMVLGLNDALVELTGTIAGLTLALNNTRLVALSAIITGVSATLSMAASNYLAERASGNPNALKSSIYTGVAYLVTVALMVLPYLLLPNDLSLMALLIMLAIVILIILFFNYYISVAQSQPFFKRFAEMAGISLGVAAISFAIGLLAKALLGIDI